MKVFVAYEGNLEFDDPAVVVAARRTFEAARDALSQHAKGDNPDEEGGDSDDGGPAWKAILTLASAEEVVGACGGLVTYGIKELELPE